MVIWKGKELEIKIRFKRKFTKGIKDIPKK